MHLCVFSPVNRASNSNVSISCRSVDVYANFDRIQPLRIKLDFDHNASSPASLNISFPLVLCTAVCLQLINSCLSSQVNFGNFFAFIVASL